jgi:hypothetical protein
MQELYFHKKQRTKSGIVNPAQLQVLLAVDFSKDHKHPLCQMATQMHLQWRKY